MSLFHVTLPARLRTLAGLGLAAVFGLALSSPALAEAAKLRSASFIVKLLEGKGMKVLDTRQHGQLYIIKVEDDGTEALLSIDGYSSEVVGLKVLKLAPGATAKPAQQSGNHFVDITYEYGYEVTEESYSSYTEVSSTELSSTSEYSSESVAASEDVQYDQVDDQTAGDLDQGQPGDDAGDQAAASAEMDIEE